MSEYMYGDKILDKYGSVLTVLKNSRDCEGYVIASYGKETDYRIVRFSDIEKIVKEAKYSAGSWMQARIALPTKTGRYAVITDNGMIFDIQYSSVHQTFNADDSNTVEEAKKNEIKVAFWAPIQSIYPQLIGEE